MTELESGQQLNSDGLPGQATTPDAAGDKQTSPQVMFTPEQEDYITELVRRTGQSEKDRAVNRIEKTVQSQQDQLDKFAALLKQPGMTVDKAKREMQIDELLSNSYASESANANGAATTAPANTATSPADFTSIYTTLNLDPSDPDVIRTTLQYASNPDKVASQLLALKASRTNQASASPASVAQAPGGATPSSDTTIESLNSEMATMMQNPVANYVRIQEIAQELGRLS